MSERFQFNETRLDGLYTITRKPITDERGCFTRLFCENEFLEAGLAVKKIIQINHTKTINKHTVRGLHFQYPPHSETKIVSCVSGEILDVAVDLRIGSKTYLKWHGEILSDKNNTSLYIPDGFAHGFQTLTDNCELMYFHTSAYESSSEGIINACDPLIGIEWPEEITGISDRDKKAQKIDGEFEGIMLL